MIMNLYSVRDVNVGFNQPFVEANDDVAIRGFAYAVNNSDIMGFQPKDFDLYCVGTFDTSNGMVEDRYPPFLVTHGTEVFNK